MKTKMTIILFLIFIAYAVSFGQEYETVQQARMFPVQIRVFFEIRDFYSLLKEFVTFYTQCL